MNQHIELSRAQRLKRTGIATAVGIAGVGGLLVLRSGSGGGHLDRKPAPISLFTNPGSKTALNSHGEVLDIKVKSGALAPSSEAASAIAQAEGERLGSVAVDAAVVKGQHLINKDLTGNSSNDEFIRGGQSLEVVTTHEIVDPNALNNYPKDLKITTEG